MAEAPLTSGTDSSAQTVPATTSAPPTTPADKKEDDKLSRKPRVCVSVIKGEACRTQMEGKVCPYSHEGAPAPETLTKVYVCHLPVNYTNEDVQKLASPYGKIQESRILVDPRSNLSRGVAFVHYEKHDEAEKAIKAINELKLPNHPTALAARYARRNRAGGRRGGGRRSRRSRSPRRRRPFRSPPRRAGRRRFRGYEDEYDDYDYDPYYPRRRGYGPPEEDYYDEGYAPYGRIPPSGGRAGGGSSGAYGGYTGPTVTNTATGGTTTGYGATQTSSTGVDGYRSYGGGAGTQSYSQTNSGYGAGARY